MRTFNYIFFIFLYIYFYFTFPKHLETIWIIRINSLNKSFISIVIPIFNKFHYLTRCVNSSLKQTDQNHLIIFVDDGSTDGSLKYLLDHTKNDQRVSIIKHIFNKGLIHARFSGVLYSNSMYILSYDPDDILYPQSIEMLNNQLRMNNFSIDVIEFIQNTEFTKKTINNYLKCTRNFSNPIDLVQNYAKTNKMSHNVHKRLIKRTIYLKAIGIIFPFVKGKRLICWEDRLQIIIIFALTNTFLCSNIPVYHYYAQNFDSSTSQKYQTSNQGHSQRTYVQSIINYILKGKMIQKIQKNDPKVPLFESYLENNSKFYDAVSNYVIKNEKIKINEKEIVPFQSIKTEETIIFFH